MNTKTIENVKIKSISCYPVCECSCSIATLRSGLCSMSSREAPRSAQCARAGWVFDYVLNKPCDCRHVSRLETQTRHRHMSLTCWTALSTLHPPLTTHTNTTRPDAGVQPISVVLPHRGRVPCATMRRLSRQTVFAEPTVFTKTESGAAPSSI